MALHTWLLYLTAVIGLVLTPGPNSLLVLTHGTLYGYKKALWTTAGGVVGFAALMALSMFGIGALLQASANALVLLKWIGGAYLVWLGFQLWRAPPLLLDAAERATAKPGTALFRQGLLSALSNPKVILFFGAFLPQFLDPQADLLLQFAVMALTFAVVEALAEFLLARAAHQVRPWLQRCGRGFNRCCGGLFAAMGAALPLTR
ncbi:LysE family translocator [Pseudomonas sp. MBLB4123]|uniref:LysE family translocator n=1 Tax=Pseudomonas sp. MBLB4123 TaxID=3451557 RepID=UPI003F7520A6